MHKSWAPDMRGIGWIAVVLAGLLGLPIGPPARAQNADAQNQDQPEYGLRFTPGMARGLADVYVKQVLKNRYELPDDKAEDAREKVARRMMQLAHKIDEPGRELLERFVEEQLNSAADGNEGNFMPHGFGKEFSERVLPILPEIRELARGVAQDVRPMLPMKKQLQMAGEMMAFKTGMDAFEATMSKWSSGEETNYDNPFEGPRKAEKLKKDEHGQTADLKRALENAQNTLDKPRATKRWARYIEQMQKLYDLDPAQVSTAQSILREFEEREQRLVSDAAWRRQIYSGEVWQNLSWRLPNAWMHPARTLIEDRLAEAKLSWNDLEEQFKARLESIPTSGQRRAATAKVDAWLKENGLQAAETQP